MSNCTNSTNYTCQQEPLQAVSYSLLFLLGLGINFAALRAFIARRKSWNDTHVYMLNLNLSDFALILFLPFRIFDAAFCLPKNFFCSFLITTHYINMYSSIMTTTAICVHRFLAIKFPLQAMAWRRKKEIAFGVCLSIWVILLTVCTVYRKENYPEKLLTCYERCWDNPLRNDYVFLLMILGFLVPLLIIVYCSSQIIYVLSKDGERSEEKRSIIGMVTANMVVFIVCYTPIHIAFLVKRFAKVSPNWKNSIVHAHIYLLASEWIATTNCCFDSISYYFLLRRFY